MSATPSPLAWLEATRFPPWIAGPYGTTLPRGVATEDVATRGWLARVRAGHHIGANLVIWMASAPEHLAQRLYIFTNEHHLFFDIPTVRQ